MAKLFTTVISEKAHKNIDEEKTGIIIVLCDVHYSGG